jgi:hypothetical protein
MPKGGYDMIEPRVIITALAVDRERVLEFFAYFSRFEYSLKRSGFLMPGENANPNWDKFANSIRGHFAKIHDATFVNAATFLLAEPPKTQVVLGNDLGWEETTRRNGEHDEKFTSRLIRTVRNNLFHGGKYPYPAGPMPDAGRNRRLLDAALTVLGQCLEISPSVRSAFEEAA